MLVNDEITTLLLGVRNREQDPLRLVSIDGYFTQPGQYESIVRNITKMPYYLEIPAESEATVAYRYKATFQPGNIGLAVDADLLDTASNRVFRVGLFRGDMTVDEPVVGFDLQVAFMYAVLTVSAVLASWFAKSVFWPSSSQQQQQKRRKSSSAVPIAAMVDSSWIPTPVSSAKVARKMSVKK